jgi:hypothetical protein
MAILISFINLILDLDEFIHPSLRNGEAFIGYESRMLFFFTRRLLATIFLSFVIFITIVLLARPQNSTHLREAFLELKHRSIHQHFIQSTMFKIAHTELASENTNFFSLLPPPLAVVAIFPVFPFLAAGGAISVSAVSKGAFLLLAVAAALGGIFDWRNSAGEAKVGRRE